MPSQMERSRARKQLTRLASNAVLAVLSESKVRSPRALAKQYGIVCREVTRRLVESFVSKEITDEEILGNPDLEFLLPTVGIRDRSAEAPEIGILVEFLQSSKGEVAPEDLGGISELFSGHKVARTGSGLTFENDKTRRGAGRVYTPFDVTRHMCESTIPTIVGSCGSLEDFLNLRIIDPACGSGAFLAQASRVLVREASSRWPDSQEKVEREVFRGIIHGVDLDPFAVSLCRLVLWMESGAPDEEVGFCLSQTDSLSMGGSPSLDEWSEVTGLESGTGYDLWIGNPPYVRVKPSEFGGFDSRHTRNLYALFCELGISLTKEGGVFSMILPQGVVVSKEAEGLRSFLLGIAGSKCFQVFDSVPDFLFDQGKIESNTNTNINQRTAIVTVEKGRGSSLLTSPLIRWRRGEERDRLFESLRTVEIGLEDTSLGKIPMLGSEEEVALFREMVGITPRIGEKIGSGQKSLFLTKAVRYFITALPRSLGRSNSIELAVPEDFFHTVHVILNSNVFYWWWRVVGNGFQLEKGDIECFPLVKLDPHRASMLSQRLFLAEKSCRVTKRNAGKDIPNVNYNYSMELIREIDSEILSCFSDLEYDFILKSKSNSLFGKMDGLVGYS